MAQHRAELDPLQLVDEIDEALQAVPEAARAEVRGAYRWVILAVVVVSAIVAVATSVVAIHISRGIEARVEAAQVSQQERDITVDTALQRLREANEDLKARGQAPVAAPADGDPGEAISAAVTARVLASIPPAPTADQVGDAIRASVTANLLGPSREQLAGLVADYFRINPPQPGPPPTEAQIRGAVDASLAVNPPPKGDKGDPCLPSTPECRGPRGEDSTVPGPRGPAPNSWTWPDPVVPGVTHTCTRSGGTDDAPDYACD